mmetsp:Transcript_15590/g.40009  ORF Transcript_15590/g.40009 Transcript_15590/m.40009 type:complete len:257 (+) Transcript_15590:3583-4353(+)
MRTPRHTTACPATASTTAWRSRARCSASTRWSACGRRTPSARRRTSAGALGARSPRPTGTAFGPRTTGPCPAGSLARRSPLPAAPLVHSHRNVITGMASEFSASSRRFFSVVFKESSPKTPPTAGAPCRRYSCRRAALPASKGNPGRICPQSEMTARSAAVAVLSGLPLASALTARTTSIPSTTCPNTVYLPSRCGAGLSMMDMCDPLVSGPMLAMDSSPFFSCFSLRPPGSSLNVPPKTLSVPAPVWMMNWSMMR